jgi:hypothetical protein
MNVPDDVEGAVFLPLVVPEWHPLDCGCFDFLGALQHEHMAKPFFSQATEGAAKLRVLLAYDVGAEIPLVPRAVPFLAELFG